VVVGGGVIVEVVQDRGEQMVTVSFAEAMSGVLVVGQSSVGVVESSGGVVEVEVDLAEDGVGAAFDDGVAALLGEGERLDRVVEGGLLMAALAVECGGQAEEGLSHGVSDADLLGDIQGGLVQLGRGAVVAAGLVDEGQRVAGHRLKFGFVDLICELKCGMGRPACPVKVPCPAVNACEPDFTMGLAAPAAEGSERCQGRFEPMFGLAQPA